MRFERTTSRLSAGCSESGSETGPDELRGRKHAESVSGGVRTFNLDDLDDYITNMLPKARPKTIEGVSSAWKQFLGFGKVLSRKTGSRNRIVELEAEITFDTINAYNQDQNTKKSGTYLGYIRTMLDYFARKRNDQLLRDWAKSLKYSSPGTKRLFAVEGEKASVTKEDVNGDFRTYYRHIIQPKKQGVSSKKSAFRNFATLLFGVTTGARVEEMNRLTWAELDQGLSTGWFIIPAPYTKTHAERVIPIHPAARPYLEILRSMYPDKPFSTDKFRDIRRNRDAALRLSQARNFAVKYWRNYGIDEKIRLAIMGHDEGAIKKEIEKEEVKTTISEVYRKYGPKEIADHYHDTVGTKFNPIPKEIDLQKIRTNLKPFLKS
jgi:integrase